MAVKVSLLVASICVMMFSKHIFGGYLLPMVQLAALLVFGLVARPISVSVRNYVEAARNTHHAGDEKVSPAEWSSFFIGLFLVVAGLGQMLRPGLFYWASDDAGFVWRMGLAELMLGICVMALGRWLFGSRSQG